MILFALDNKLYNLWLLFLLLIDKNNLRSMLGGVIAVILAIMTDYGGVNWFNLYHFQNVVIPFGGCSFFYIFGMIFTMGTLFSQYYPQKRWYKISHIMVMSLLFLANETLLIMVGVAAYVNWNTWASLLVNILALSAIGWVTEVFKLNTRKAIY